MGPGSASGRAEQNPAQPSPEEQDFQIFNSSISNSEMCICFFLGSNEPYELFLGSSEPFQGLPGNVTHGLALSSGN